ncbi:hypothetical protein BgiMline_033586 [Biomphalaria glabrata]
MQQILTTANNVTESYENETTTASSVTSRPQGALWVPYLAVLFFLLTMAILIFSIYRYGKRVRKRQRTILDYLEVDIDLNRRRICGIMRTPITIRFDEIHRGSIGERPSGSSFVETIQNIKEDYQSKYSDQSSPLAFRETRMSQTSSRGKLNDNRNPNVQIWNVERCEEKGTASLQFPPFDEDDFPLNKRSANAIRAKRNNGRLYMKDGGFYSEPELYPLCTDSTFPQNDDSLYKPREKNFFEGDVFESQEYSLKPKCLNPKELLTTDFILNFTPSEASSLPCPEQTCEKRTKSPNSRRADTGFRVSSHLRQKLRSDRRRFFSDYSINNREGYNPNEMLDELSSKKLPSGKRGAHHQSSSKVLKENVWSQRTTRNEVMSQSNTPHLADTEVHSQHVHRSAKIAKEKRASSSRSRPLSSLKTALDTRGKRDTNCCLDIETIEDAGQIYKTKSRRKTDIGNAAETEMFVCGSSWLEGGSSNPGSDTTDSSVMMEQTDL